MYVEAEEVLSFVIEKYCKIEIELSAPFNSIIGCSCFTASAWVYNLILT